jgi:C1A family cysteine protease
MGAKVAATGVVPMPADSDNVEGGHAIDIIGYNDQSQENAGIPGLHVVFRNSWSDQWGADGYGFLPYDYVIGGQYASDGWMIRTI